MLENDPLLLSDRQARAVIIAAELRSFQREPDLYIAWYDHDLHEDARAAAEHLRSVDPAALEEALVAPETMPAVDAARRITDSGRFSFADADVVIEAATSRLTVCRSR